MQRARYPCDPCVEEISEGKKAFVACWSAHCNEQGFLEQAPSCKHHWLRWQSGLSSPLSKDYPYNDQMYSQMKENMNVWCELKNSFQLPKRICLVRAK
jgi:hypothetical protein